MGINNNYRRNNNINFSDIVINYWNMRHYKQYIWEEIVEVIDIINMIANGEELPKEIEYNGDIGKLVQYERFTNYILERDGDKYDMYWLIDHDLGNLHTEVICTKLKLKQKKRK